MKISALTEALKRLQMNHGDIDVAVNKGYSNPSLNIDAVESLNQSNITVIERGGQKILVISDSHI